MTEESPIAILDKITAAWSGRLRGIRMVNFANTFLSYLVVLGVIVIVAGVAIAIGISLRKKKNKEEEQ